VRWSIVANPEDITGTGSGFIELTESPDWVVALAVLKNKLYAFKERSIWELVYVGGTTVFRPDQRVEGVGTYSPHSIVNLGEELLFYGTDNIYLYDGIDLSPIGGQIYPYLYETENRLVNAARANRAPSAYIEELKSYQICLPTESGSPDLLAEYNFDMKAWTLRTRQITAYGFYSVTTGNRWLDLTGTWEARTWKWMEKALPAGAPTTLMGDSDGNIWEDDRLIKSTDYMCWETKDWMFAHSERVVEFRIQAKGGPFTCYYSFDQGKTWESNTKEFAVSTDWTEYSWPLNFTCQYVRVRIDSYAEDIDIKWVEPWYIPRARSKSLVT